MIVLFFNSKLFLCFYTKMCLFSQNNIVFHKVYILYFLYILKILSEKEEDLWKLSLIG